jgi:imidazoleglycerol-phosphate dehydratase
VRRDTRETAVSVDLALDGSGRYDVSTGVGMLDHMLEQLARHGLFDITIKASGDIDRDPHHLVEDVGLVLGQALNGALGERRGITRFGYAIVPLDEALALVAVDLGGRGHASIEFEFGREMLGQLPTENIRHFLEALAREGRLNLHVRELAGENDHHRVEAAFKALALSLRQAVTIDPRVAGEVPSTKDALEAPRCPWPPNQQTREPANLWAVGASARLLQLEAVVLDDGVGQQLAAHLRELLLCLLAVLGGDAHLQVLAGPHRLHVGEAEGVEGAADGQPLGVVYCWL